MRHFRDFWPYYLQEHARPGTRAMHYAGTSLVVALVASAPLLGGWWLALALPLAGYGFAWAGHGLSERNRPATFRYPLWSLRADSAPARLRASRPPRSVFRNINQSNPPPP